MKTMISLVLLTILSGCAALNPNPFAKYNSAYLESKIIELEAPKVLDLGDEKLVVKSDWNHEKPFRAQHVSDTYYRYVDGKLQEIDVMELKKTKTFTPSNNPDIEAKRKVVEDSLIELQRTNIVEEGK